jgi:hypothetical protein
LILKLIDRKLPKIVRAANHWPAASPALATAYHRYTGRSVKILLQRGYYGKNTFPVVLLEMPHLFEVANYPVVKLSSQHAVFCVVSNGPQESNLRARFIGKTADMPGERPLGFTLPD